MKLILAIMVAVLIWPSIADSQNQYPEKRENQVELWVFTAKWCAPCRKYKSTLKLAKNQGIKIRSIDIDKYKKLAKRFHITSIPTTVVMKEQKRVMGNIPLKSLLKLVE